MPYFVASPCIVSPAACPCRISSNNSTLALLSIPASFHPGLGVGQIRRSKWAKSDDRTQSRNRSRLAVRPSLLLGVVADVVAVAFRLPHRVGVHHRRTARNAEEEPAQQSTQLVPRGR